MPTLRLPVELSSQMPPRLRTKINRWVQYNLQQSEQGIASGVTSEAAAIISALGAELASELELHYAPGMMIAVSPEAVELIESLPAMLEKAGTPVPSEVNHLLSKLKKHRRIAEETKDAGVGNDTAARNRGGPR